MTQAMLRFIEKKGVVPIPQEIVPRKTFTVDSQLEDLEEDLVINCLAKLQDGIKVTSVEATGALEQYRKFRVEMGRLQTLINRPSVIVVISFEIIKNVLNVFNLYCLFYLFDYLRVRA